MYIFALYLKRERFSPPRWHNPTEYACSKETSVFVAYLLAEATFLPSWREHPWRPSSEFTSFKDLISSILRRKPEASTRAPGALDPPRVILFAWVYLGQCMFLCMGVLPPEHKNFKWLHLIFWAFSPNKVLPEYLQGNFAKSKYAHPVGARGQLASISQSFLCLDYEVSWDSFSLWWDYEWKMR